ncbi:MAG: sugar-binding transcriptional regulator [Anaerolineae bacterium]|nr:sugar-binding transcriptional regulator [Anaerolineae bacterium]
MPPADPNELQKSRLISRVLHLYYMEERSQAEIARLLGLSTAGVNRLLKAARQQGLVEIKINLPHQHIFDLETRLAQTAGLQRAVVVPHLDGSPQTLLAAVGQAGAALLSEQLRGGDTVCISGGRTVASLVEALAPQPPCPDVHFVPALGGVQGRHYTDVNNLAAELARKTGGSAYQLHAPAFADTPAERDALCALRQVSEVLERARRARIALVGVGSLQPEDASYFYFTALADDERRQLLQRAQPVAEILARLIDSRGQPCAPELDRRVVGMDLDDLRRIPLVIGIAADAQKVQPILAALRGGYLDALVTDEDTARAVLAQLSTSPPVSERNNQ